MSNEKEIKRLMQKAVDALKPFAESSTEYMNTLMCHVAIGLDKHHCKRCSRAMAAYEAMSEMQGFIANYLQEVKE